MQDLINKLVAEAGLNAEQATKALTTMLDHVKSKLPSAMHGTLDAMLGNATPDAANVNASAEPSLMDKAGDMAGDAKEKLTDMAGAAKEKFAAFTTPENLDHLKEQATEKLDDLKEQAGDMAKDALGKLKGLFGGGDKA